MEPILRLAREEDLPAMLALYVPYVMQTTASLEWEPPGPEEFRRRFVSYTEKYPWLVCQQEDALAGFAYAHRYGERKGYDWSAETSIYVRQNCCGAGMGRFLYTALLALLKAQGVATAYAVITHPNPPSEAFHRRMGFTRQGLLTAAGRKFGKPVDVGYYACALHPPESVQVPPVPLNALPAILVEEILLGQR